MMFYMLFNNKSNQTNERKLGLVSNVSQKSKREYNNGTNYDVAVQHILAAEILFIMLKNEEVGVGGD